MRINFFLILFLSLGRMGFAQQRPQYTQYILNQYLVNPAVTGIENYGDLKLGGRDQWEGIKGAPQTFYLTFHTPLGKKDDKTTATSFQKPGENPRGKSYWENYTPSDPHHGIGFSLVNYNTGLYNRFTADLSYAYHIGLTTRTNLAAGVQAGLNRLGYRAGDAVTSDPMDPVLENINGDVYKINPDLALGLWLYGANYFAGVSAQQLIPVKVKFATTDPGSMQVPHYFFTTGYRYLLNEDVNLLPSIMVKYVPNTPTKPQADFNVKAQYRDLLWIGGSYRQGNGFAAMLGLNTGNTFNISYAYDFTQTRLNTASGGSHELVLGFLINNKYSDSCPRNVW